MAQKFLTNNAGTITEVQAPVTSAGAGSNGLIPALNAAGVLDTSFMPSGVGADTQAVLTTEVISAGAYVNIWNNTGAYGLRNADNTAAGKEAHGFVLAGFSSGVSATVYFNGNNTAVTGQTPGKVFLGVTGGTSATAPTGTGKVVQVLGISPASTVINSTLELPIILA